MSSRKDSHAIILEGTKEEKQSILRAFDDLIDFNPLKDVAVALPGTQLPGYSPVYRNKYVVEKNNNQLVELIHPKLNTSYNYWANAVNQWPDSKCLGQRNTAGGKVQDFYTFQTYREVDEMKNYIGSGILELVTNHPRYKPCNLGEIYPSNNGNQANEFVVSILSANRPEWVITDLACQAYSLCSTTLYDNLGAETASYILSLMQSPVVFTTKDRILFLLSIVKQYKLSKLLVIVSFDQLDFQSDYFFFKLAQDVGVDLYDFNNLAKLGKLIASEINPPVPDTPYTVCFTSGTTGVSKGVLITHLNMATSLAFCFHHWPRPVKENSIGVSSATNDTQLKSYCLLPLAHIYERQTTTYSLVSNIAVGFPSGGISSRIEDCSILKPNYLQAVPRIYSKIEQELKHLIENNSFLKSFVETKFKLLFNHLETDEAKKFKFKTVSQELEFQYYDVIVTSKLRQLQGLDRVKLCLSASAPISLITQNYICTVLNIGFVQNYGASEVTSACTGESSFNLRITKEMLTSGKKKSIASCSGPVSVTTDIKLKDLPDLGYVYDSPDGKPKGEVLFRGPQVFKKYVYKEDITKGSFEGEWYRTGDICEIGNDGKLYVIDRIKNFFKLSQGEYLTPERIENIYLSNIPFVNQCFIHGFSDKDFIVGIIGIIPSELTKFFTKVADLDTYNNFKITPSLRTKIKLVILNIRELDQSLTEKQIEQAQEISLTDTQANVTRALLTTINNDIILKSLVLKEMNEIVTKNKNVTLASYEKIYNLSFGVFPLSIRTGLLTPTLKLQRPTSIKKYRPVIEQLYEEGHLFKSTTSRL